MFEFITKECRYAQPFWMKEIPKEHNVKHDVMTLHCNYLGAVIISENSSKPAGTITLTSIINLPES